MRNLIVFAIAILNMSDYAQACSCTQYTLNPESAIENAAEIAINGGRSMKVISIEKIKAYPSIFEKLNIGGFKGTACEIKGPNGESLNYCSSKVKSDSKVIVTKFVSTGKEVKCTIIVRSVSKYTSVSAKVISQTCE